MPFQYNRDDTGRCVRLTASDPLTLAEMMEIGDRQLADGAWKYGTLVDLRMVCAPASATDLRAFMEHFRELLTTHGRRGPLVVVARAVATIASAQMYASVGGTVDRAFEIFWDIDDAEKWLERQLR